MLFNVFYKRSIGCLLIVVVIAIAGLQPVFSQVGQNPLKDTVITTLNDSLLPNLVMKVAAYTSTIDHTDFLIKRKFNTTPISLDLPEIERKVKGFKTGLETKGSQMNLSSLNTGVIMLNEITDKLSAYQRILTKYSNELTTSNREIKKILLDPLLNARVQDSVLLEQLEDIRTEGLMLDSLQQKTLNKVQLLRNRVSINLLQGTDVISDMGYLSITHKMGMWSKEEPALFSITQRDYENKFIHVIGAALTRSAMIMWIYVNGNWNVLTIGLVILVFLFSWTIINRRRVKKQQKVRDILEPVNLLGQSVLVGCLVAFFTYLPFLFGDPPMSLMHACELLRLVSVCYLLYPFLSKDSKILWTAICVLWLYYALDDILLESALGERCGLFVAGILLSAICIKIINVKKPFFKILPESPATKAVVIFTLTQAVLSIVFNLTGRASLAKIFGVSAVQCLVLGLTLKVLCTMVVEAIYLQSEAYENSRFSEFINFKNLQYKLLRFLWILAIVIFALSLIRNLTLYEAFMQILGSFFNETRTIGSMQFSFKSIAVFICIIWLSSVISTFINFFFGYGKLDNPNKRSRMGSMMLLIRLTIWTLGFCIAVAAAGIPLDRISLMLGALGVGIGFGLQNIVNNLVSGVIIAFERPIQVGDLIEVGGKTGVVKEIGVRSSKINNNSGGDIIVPNGDLLSQHLINWTMQDRRKQVNISISIPYTADLKSVTSLIKEPLERSEKIIQTPAPTILVQEFGDRAIDLKILFWVFDLNEAGSIRSVVMSEIFETLTANGIDLQVNKSGWAEYREDKP
jgi:potassium efflux system protein